MTGKIYSIPELKEPEKSSSWESRGEPKIELRDDQAANQERRKKEIRDSMAPAGSLNLCPLLEQRRQKYGIPDGVFKTAAGFDRILVYPIDPFEEQAGKFSGTSLWKPELTLKRDTQEGYRGVIVNAGLIAADRLMSHGIELGHIVMTNKNVPFSRRVQQFSDFDVFVLVMRDGDLAGSETLQEEILAGKKKIMDVGGDDGFNHQIAELVDGEWIVRKKKSVYVTDTW